MLWNKHTHKLHPAKIQTEFPEILIGLEISLTAPSALQNLLPIIMTHSDTFPATSESAIRLNLTLTAFEPR